MSEKFKGVVKVLDADEGACIEISGKLDDADLMVISSMLIKKLSHKHNLPIKALTDLIEEQR